MDPSTELFFQGIPEFHQILKLDPNLLCHLKQFLSGIELQQLTAVNKDIHTIIRQSVRCVRLTITAHRPDILQTYLLTFTNLSSLNLNHCSLITDEDLLHISKFSNLTNLNLQGCSLTNKGIISFPLNLTH